MLPAVLTILALSTAAKYTIGLAGVFFVAFPLLAHGLIAVAAARVAAEREENRRFREGLGD